MSVRDEILAANAAHVATFGDRGELARAPARKVAVLTCLDARLDPARFAGLGEGDACVIRNAGGRASDDAIRSLVVSHKLLGTREWFVIHHSDCGMEVVTNELMGDLFAQSLDPAAVGPDGVYDVGQGPGSPEGRNIDWLPISDRRAERRRRRAHASQPPARLRADRDLRVRLRRQDGPAAGGA